ncbi:galactose-1-phosphate uridylyltransferase [Rhodococcus sp. X156]|uniref:galactose-1-phosphate uridylyltransferase n=1 Tax=Rhodococcus sp. X156 TaxID=2499145 RepID=UPI000FDBF319|nr:galactose-1-phosphate uridylyltransferase [Rhodococcus sp. X156]
MIVTRRQLADGREIIYFDDPATTGSRAAPFTRTATDRRDLPAVVTDSQCRRDPLTGEWVVIAAHRQDRTYLPAADLCPLCPSAPGRPTEVPEPSYQVVALENRFASLGTSSAVPAPDAVPAADLRPGVGRCEVVCFTSEHRLTFAELDPRRVRLVVDAWAQRTAELGARADVAQVFCFENHGEEIGVTLHHPHGQVYAYPFVPPRVRTVLEQARHHEESTGRNLFADVLAAERAGPRVVAANEHWTAFVPAASRWPHEVQLFPHRQVPDLPALTDAERDALVPVYLDVLGRFAHRFDTPMPYVAAWNQAPTGRCWDAAGPGPGAGPGAGRQRWWLHLQLFSFRRTAEKLKYLAGSESGMGVFVSDTNPETVAAQLRAVALP